MSNIQTCRRMNIMKNMLEIGEILEIGIATHRITDGKTLDCVHKYNPDYLCDLNKEAIPVEDESFDVVVAGEILEHLINPYNAVREFCRILNNKGCLIISVPNCCSLANRINMLFGILPSYCARPEDEESPERHVCDFNLKVLLKVLDKANFRTEIITSNGMISRSKLITKFIPASMGETLIVKARKVDTAFINFANDKIDCEKHGLTLKENGECYKCKISSNAQSRKGEKE